MMERINYWRGFTGGFLAGVAIGTLIYIYPGICKGITGTEGDQEQPVASILHDGLMENSTGGLPA
jgi:hypothetical protein